MRLQLLGAFVELKSLRALQSDGGTCNYQPVLCSFCFFVTSVLLLCWRTAKTCVFALYNIMIHCLSVHCCQLPPLYSQSCWLRCIDPILWYNSALLLLFVHHWIPRWAIPAVITLLFWLPEKRSYRQILRKMQENQPTQALTVLAEDGWTG